MSYRNLRRPRLPSLTVLWAVALVAFATALWRFDPVTVEKALSVTAPGRHPGGLALASASLVTFVRMAASLALALPCAFLLTTISRRHTLLGQTLSSLFEIGRAAPFIGLAALFPFSDKGFGYVAATALTLIILISQNARCASSDTPANLTFMCHALGLTRWQTFWRVHAPILTPAVLSSLVAAMPMAWMTLCGEEFLFSDSRYGNASMGLGAFLHHAFLSWSYRLVLEACLAMALLVIGFNAIFLKPSTYWSQRFKMTTDGNIPGNRLYNYVHRIAYFEALTKWAHRHLLKLAHLPLFPDRVSGRDVTPPRWKEKRDSRILPGAVMIISFGYIWYDVRIFGHPGNAWALILSLLQTALLVVISGGLALTMWIWISVWMRHDAVAQRPTPLIIRVLSDCPTLLLIPPVIHISNDWNLPYAFSALAGIFLAQQWGISVGCYDTLRRFPPDILEMARNLNVRGRLWWQKVYLPGTISSLRRRLSASIIYGWNVAIFLGAITSTPSADDINPFGMFFPNLMAQGDLRLTLSLIVFSTVAAWFCVTLIERGHQAEGEA